VTKKDLKPVNTFIGAKRFVVVDVETTCWDPPRWTDNETIQIAAQWVDGDFGRRPKTGGFDSFVRPKDEPELSPFCRGLTHIIQPSIDTADSFPTVLAAFLEYCSLNYPGWNKTGTCVSQNASMWVTDLVFCSWTPFDRRQLIADCERWGLEFPFIHTLDIAALYGERRDCSRRTKLKDAASAMGYHELENEHWHSATMDVDAATHILQKLRWPLTYAGGWARTNSL
jgi:inhibitor of KinA sporulation pathway (predicted exonuclease)